MNIKAKNKIMKLYREEGGEHGVIFMKRGKNHRLPTTMPAVFQAGNFYYNIPRTGWVEGMYIDKFVGD